MLYDWSLMSALHILKARLEKIMEEKEGILPKHLCLKC